MGDETFYVAALEEYESGAIDVGLKAKAYVAADGVESRIKIEYMKLRVQQLKGGSGGGSLRSWFNATSSNERVTYVVVSIILIALYGIGLIPLSVLIGLQLGERDELARQAEQREPEQQNRTSASFQSSPPPPRNEVGAVDELNSDATSARPIVVVVVSLVAAIIASVLSGSVQQFGSFAALGNATVGSNLLMGAVAMMLLLPLIHVGIASIWESNRDPRSRRNIFFGWGVAVTILQLLILASKVAA